MQHLELIGQHLLQLLLSQHAEALLQHLPLVAGVSRDGLEGQAEVQTSFLDVTADPVQIRVSQIIFGVLEENDIKKVTEGFKTEEIMEKHI